MMNTNRTLPQVLILATVLTASAFACSVHAADATLSFTGEIIPANNGAKATENNEKSALSTNRESTKKTNINKGEDHATR